jgi:hypothetical protein
LDLDEAYGPKNDLGKQLERQNDLDVLVQPRGSV